MEGTTFIRQAVEQDIEHIALLYTEFHQFHVSGLPDRLRSRAEPDDETATRELYANLLKIIEDKHANIFVADVNGAIVGLVEVYLKRDDEHPLTVSHCYGYVQSLVVTEAYLKAGLGQCLMVAASEWARALGATEVRLETWEFAEGPLPFYEKMGYRTLRRVLVRPLA